MATQEDVFWIIMWSIAIGYDLAYVIDAAREKDWSLAWKTALVMAVPATFLTLEVMGLW